MPNQISSKSKSARNLPNSPDYHKYFDVLVHNNEVLVIQTHAGLVNVTEYSSKPCKNSYGEFNLGLHVNDDAKKVLANRAKLLAAINDYLACKLSEIKPVKSIYWLNQIHSNQVVNIEPTKYIMCNDDSSINLKENQLAKNLSLTPPSADAMITQQTNSALAIMTADCVPIVIHDPASGQIAAIHAGWQGLANGIVFNTCKKMVEASALYANADPNLKTTTNHNNDDISPFSEPDSNDCISSLILKESCQGWHAWIGACISQPCYEVSNVVIEKLLNGCQQLGMDIDVLKKQVVAKHSNPNKAWLDIPAVATLQLQKMGIQINKINSNNAFACSYSNGLRYEELKNLHSKITKGLAKLNDINNIRNTHFIDNISKDYESKTPQVAHSFVNDDRLYYSYRRKTHLGEINTGRMALIIVRLA